MIIEPKSTRQGGTEGERRKRFDFNTPERLSKAPLFIGLFVVAVAAYIKSAFGEVLAAAPQTDRENRDPEGNGELPPDEIDEITTGSIESIEEPQNRIGRGLPWETEFLPPDSPDLAFVNTFEPYRLVMDPFLPAAFSLLPSNDNGADPPDIVDPIGGGSGPVGGSPGPWPGSKQPGTDYSDEDEDEDEDAGAGGEGGNGNGGDTDEKDDDDEDEDQDGSDPLSNRLPAVLGPVRLQDVFAGQVVLIGLSELLFGAYDADGDQLNIFNLTVEGATVSQTGADWLLTSEHGTLGPVTFTYAISDGEGSVMQTAYLEIVRNVEILTPGDDVHFATPYDDDVDGLASDDIIDAGEGYDLVVGGAGDDHIIGGDGNDHLLGGAGCDVIFGGKGDDLIRGGANSDRLFGDGGEDILHGEGGKDTLYGGADDDIVDGGTGNDSLHGEAGSDVLLGGDGCDVLDGGDGGDVLMAGAQDDTLTGGAGDDLLDGGTGDDLLEGGAGGDELIGAAGCDELIGGEGADVLIGGQGDDVVDAGQGDDTVIAGMGDDGLDGGDGHDVLDLTAATASLMVDYTQGSAAGDDIGIDSFANVEEVKGGAGDDVFVLGATATVTSGGWGRDTFVFEVTDEDPTLSEDVMHEILDFVVGDRVRVRDYDITSAASDAEEDLFESVYGDDDDDWLKSDLPILTRHERYDDVDHTIIQADVDRDDVYEITINLHGIHLPLTTSNTDLA